MFETKSVVQFSNVLKVCRLTVGVGKGNRTCDRFQYRAGGDDRQLSCRRHRLRKEGARHYLQNTGNTNLVYMEVFRADRFEEVLLADWLAHSPVDMVAETLNLDPTVIAQFPKNRPDIVPT
jgi:hypothetical protein